MSMTILTDEVITVELKEVVRIEQKDYDKLNNKPQINSVTLQGNKSALELALVPTDLLKLEAVEQPTKSVRQTANMFVDNGGKPSKIALQQVKGMATKVVYANELENVDFEKLDVDDYVILGDKIYRVVDVENNIKQLLPETSAEHVTFADKQGEYTSTNVEDALAEVMDIAKTGGVTGVKGDAETAYRKGNVNITKENIGLGKVDNTSDLDKPISNAQAAAIQAIQDNVADIISGAQTVGKATKVKYPFSMLGNVSVQYNGEHERMIEFSRDSFRTNYNVNIFGVELKNTGVTAGTYNGITVDAKGRVVSAEDKDYASKQYVQDGLAGKSRSISFANYQAFVAAVNDYDNTTFKVGDNAFVKTLGVPDMWVTAVNSQKATYTYTNDQAIVNALNTTNGLTVGYYTFSLLETEKIDLTSYQQKADDGLNTTDKTVVGAINEVKGTADNALSKANTNATEISQIKDGTTKVKKAERADIASDAVNVTGMINATAISDIFETDGATAKKATHASKADNATNVTTNINGKAISSIFETNGTTAKEATHAGKATSADKATQADSASKVANSLTFSGQNAQGTESTIGFDGSQAQEVAFNGDDFVATKGNAFEVSLAPSGATAGTYNNVTIDEKGRVTAGSNKDYATTGQVNAKYTKPSDGIPKSDLAEDVKTSLGKADTALQNVPSYNDLPNIPVINQDLTASGFTPVANTYYRHTGTTTASYTNGVIYFYNGTKYASLDGSGGGSTAVTEQVTVAVDDWVLDGITYKQAPTNPIVAGDVLTTLYVDNTKTPDFTAFDWSGATADDSGFQHLTIVDGSKDVKINKYPQGTEIDENTTFTTDQYEIAISGDAVPYMTDEWAVANGLTTGGWVFSGSATIQSNTVVETYQQDIWGEYISKDGQWQQVPVGSSTIPPFAYRATKTIGTEMGVNSVVSLGYNDSASMRECASAGVAIGEVPTVSGNVITFYSVTKPTQAVNLVVEISETTTNA